MIKLLVRRGKIKAHLTGFLLINFSLVFGQRETDQWYFGNKAALDFSNGPPVSVSGSSMQTAEGSSSIADNNGNLLFYTNGIEIWNKNHQVMANGSSINGSTSSTQVLIVRQPGSNHIYYVFTVPELGQGSLSFTKVDMTLASGSGSVVVKNQVLEPAMTEKICGTTHCNGSDVWVLTHKHNSDAFYAYLVNSSGVNTAAVVSSAGSVHSTTLIPNTSAAGYMKISSTGKKIGLNFGKDVQGYTILEMLDLILLLAW